MIVRKILKQNITVQVEADLSLKDLDAIMDGIRWTGTGDMAGIEINVTPTKDGHGFGLTEVLEVAVAIGTTVTADLIADAIRAAVRGTIRRISVGKTEADGSTNGIVQVVRTAQNETEPNTSPRNDSSE